MNAECTGAQDVMSNTTWNLAIGYIDKDNAKSTSEAVSNGIWNEILQRNFPFPKYMIAPEQRQTTGKRPDFTIFFVDHDKQEWYPVFTFEGKAPYHEKKKFKMERGKAQAAGYVKSLSWSNQEEKNSNKKITYGMFACGKSFTILEYDVDTEIARVFMEGIIDTDAKEFDDFCGGRDKLFL